MKKLIFLVTALALFVVLSGSNPATAFGERGMIYLAQQTQESANKQSETPTDEILDEAKTDEEDEYDDDEYDDDEYADEEDVELIPDPFIEMNTGLYHFNDKLYFWVLKPVATGYRFVLPTPVRVSVKNFFFNLLMPVRLVNCLLQGKPKAAEGEFGRFVVNSIIGTPTEGVYKDCHSDAVLEA